jgi:hypothetical protein
MREKFVTALFIVFTFFICSGFWGGNHPGFYWRQDASDDKEYVVEMRTGDGVGSSSGSVLTVDFTLIQDSSGDADFRIYNDTSTDVDGSRVTQIHFDGRDASGDRIRQGSITFAHDGSGHDHKAIMTIGVNDGDDSDDPSTRMQITAAGGLVYTPSSAQVIDATSDAILANAIMIVLNPDADYTTDVTPTIADGVPGQILYITCANGEANRVRLQDEDYLAGTNLELGDTSRDISGKDVLTLIFDGTDWIEQSYVNN